MAPLSKEDKILIKSLYECKGYNAKNCRRRQPPMSFDAPAQGNPREYPREPYISRN